MKCKEVVHALFMFLVACLVYVVFSLFVSFVI